MGNGASVKKEGDAGVNDVTQVINDEKQKPVNGEDVDTPRGETAKNEVKRLRALLAQVEADQILLTKAALGSVPSLTAYLEKSFQSWDVDANGMLSGEEFWKMLEGLQLNISEQEMEQLRVKTDVDADGNVSLSEFLQAAPTFLQDIAQAREPAPELDWMQLETEDGHAYYYNKRSGESTWDAPAEYVENVEAMAKQKESEMSIDIKEYLTQAFQSSDTDGSGLLDETELWNLLQQQTNIGFSEEQYEKLKTIVDVDNDGKVRWEEFVTAADSVLKAINDNFQPQ